MNKSIIQLPIFSFYKGPISNCIPYKSVTINDIYRGLTSDYYKLKTEQLRSLNNKEEQYKLKKTLDFVSFGGVFGYRKKEGIINYSGYVTIDIDDIVPDQIVKIKELLINDDLLETQLIYVSPRGNGLKWIVEVDLVEFPDYEINWRGIVGYLRKTHTTYFNDVRDYIDESGKDVSRACFLCYDPQAYINPKYINHAG